MNLKARNGHATICVTLPYIMFMPTPCILLLIFHAIITAFACTLNLVVIFDTVILTSLTVWLF